MIKNKLDVFKKFSALLIAVSVLFTFMPLVAITVVADTFPAPNATVTHTGTVGAPWRLYDDGTLIVDGGSVSTSSGINLTSPWNAHRDNIHRIIFTGNITAGASLNGLFGNLPNVITIEGLEFFDTSNVTSMRTMFLNSSNLTELNLSSWDTRKVTDMSSIFSGVTSLRQLTLGSNFKFVPGSLGLRSIGEWHNVGGGFVFTTEELMRDYDGSIHAGTWTWQAKQTHSGTVGVGGAPWQLYDDSTLVIDTGTIHWVNDQSPWDAHRNNIRRIVITGAITAGASLRCLFMNLQNVNAIEGLEHFDTSNVTDMSSMFGGMQMLTSLDVSSFYTGNVTNMNAMFNALFALTELDVLHFNTRKVTDMNYMFYGMRSLTELDVSNFDTSNVTDMSYMFWAMSSLTELDVSSFDTSNVTNMSQMFYAMSGLTELDLSNFDTNNVTDMGNMFSGLNSLSQLTLGENFHTRNTLLYLPDVPTNATYTGKWRNVGNGTVDNPLGNFVIASSDLASPAFDGTTMTDTWVWQTVENASIPLPDNAIISLGRWNSDGAPWRLYNDGTLVVDAGSILSGDQYWGGRPWIAHRDNIRKIIFTGPISGGLSLSALFEGLSNLTTIEGLGYFDTRWTTNMSGMFSGTSSLTSLDLSIFNTSRVTNMQNMFQNASSLTTLDLSNFDTRNVTNMVDMFAGTNPLLQVTLGTNFTVVKEPTPNITIDFINERLTGFVAGAAYSIDGAPPITMIGKTLPVEESWMTGERRTIVRKSNGITTLDSDPLEIWIPQRQSRPFPNKTNCTITENNNGTITNLGADRVEYSRDGINWTHIPGTSLTGLTAGTYYLRTAASEYWFRSIIFQVNILINQPSDPSFEVKYEVDLGTNRGKLLFSEVPLGVADIDWGADRFVLAPGTKVSRKVDGMLVPVSGTRNNPYIHYTEDYEFLMTEDMNDPDNGISLSSTIQGLIGTFFIGTVNNAGIIPVMPTFEVKHEWYDAGFGTLYFSEEPIQIIKNDSFYRREAYVFPVDTKVAMRIGTHRLYRIYVLGESPLQRGGLYHYADGEYEVTLTENMGRDRKGVRVCSTYEGRGFLTIFINEGPTVEKNLDYELLLQWNSLVHDLLPTSQVALNYYKQQKMWGLGGSSGLQQLNTLAASITAGKTTDYEKAKAIQHWVATNIWYDIDYMNYSMGNGPKPELADIYEKNIDSWVIDMLNHNRGICGWYTALTVALLRAAGIPTIHTTGMTEPSSIHSAVNDEGRDWDHDWTLAYADNRWIIMDTTWDSYNLYENKVYSLQRDGGYKYFDISIEDISKERRSAMRLDQFVTEVVIPEGVTALSEYAFWDCPNLKRITLPDSVISIPDGAFDSCPGIVLHVNSGTYAEEYAKRNGYAFVVTVVESSFDFDPATGTVTGYSRTGGNAVIPATIDGVAVRNIAASTFANSPALMGVTIPASVTYIDVNAFKDCRVLMNINIDADNLNYASEGGVLYNKAKTTLIRYPSGKTGTTFTIPNNILSIDKHAFVRCVNLTSISIPNNVNAITDGAFKECHNLLNINVSSGNISFMSANGVLFNKNQTALIRYPEAKTGEFTMPSGVTTIRNEAFAGCQKLTGTIIMPMSAVSIGSQAFLDCEALELVIIPNRLTTIGDDAFWNCSATIFAHSGSLAHDHARQTGTPFVAIKTEAPSFVVKYETQIFDGSVLMFSEAPTEIFTGDQYYQKKALKFPQGTKVVQKMHDVFTPLYVANESTIGAWDYADSYYVIAPRDAQLEIELTGAMRGDANGVRICSAYRQRGLLTIFVDESIAIPTPDILGITPGISTVEVEIENPVYGAKLIVAVYSGGKLTGMVTATISAEKIENGIMTLTGITISEELGIVVKAMIWSNMDIMEPLCPLKAITWNGSKWADIL